MSDISKWALLRHKFIYGAVRLILPFLLKKYSFTTDMMPEVKGNYLVMANHLTEVDMFMVASAFKRHMYFVAGEHLLRSKNGPLLKWAQDPIFEPKGASSLGTLQEIVKRVKDGHNVMIFPEGSRSFNGETETLPESVAKLVRLCKCGLVTYHIEGGYFVAPRWAYTFRTGPMKGNIVKFRSAEEVAKLSNRELTDIINREIYENAYETQRRNRYAYKGERLAEGLENYLVKCPSCGMFDSLTSSDDAFTCSECGLKGNYGEDGFLKGRDLRFDSVYDWGKWAEEETERYIETVADGDAAFVDRDVRVNEILSDHTKIGLITGDISGYTDHFSVGENIFSFKQITALNMLYYGKSLLFTCDNRYYEIIGDRFHAIKYFKLYERFKRLTAAKRRPAKKR